MTFRESLAVQIATTQARLVELKNERKKLIKKLKTLSIFLEELNNSNPIPEEANHE